MRQRESQKLDGSPNPGREDFGHVSRSVQPLDEAART